MVWKDSSKMIRFAIVAVTLAILGCSGPEQLEPPPQQFGDAEEFPGSDDLAPPHCDAPGDELDVHEDGETVDKGGNFVVLQGWAARHSNTPFCRCFNSQGDPIFPCQCGFEPCTMVPGPGGIGFTCNRDLNWASMKEAKDNTIDRCGTDAAAYAPCLLPAGDQSLAGKTWYYKVITSDCPNDASKRIQFRQGVANAFENVDDDSRITFTLTDASPPPPQTITVRCATAAEISTGMAPTATARAVISGPLEFEFGFVADPPFQEQCDGDWFGTRGAGPYPFKTDRVFSYKTATIAFNWDVLWYGTAGITSCPQHQADPVFQKRYIEYITLHELGHVFGFPHFTYTSASTNVMRAPTGDTIGQNCQRMNQPPQDNAYPFPMLDALGWFQADTEGLESGTISFQGISCLKPGAGN